MGGSDVRASEPTATTSRMAGQRDLTGLGEIHALLGRGTEFEGLLSFEGRVRIDGCFRGRICSEGILVVGDGAEVEASIEVGTLVVRGGCVRGEIRARQLVEIHATGAVYGDITAPQIDMDRGCVFEGRSVMATKSEPASEREGQAASGTPGKPSTAGVSTPPDAAPGVDSPKGHCYEPLAIGTENVGRS